MMLVDDESIHSPVEQYDQCIDVCLCRKMKSLQI